MKNLVYRLTNGQIVTTLRDAMMSGQGYKAEYINVPTSTVIAPTRQQMLKEKGFVAPVTKRF
jgi:hypothetical protein